MVCDPPQALQQVRPTTAVNFPFGTVPSCVSCVCRARVLLVMTSGLWRGRAVAVTRKHGQQQPGPAVTTSGEGGEWGRPETSAYLARANKKADTRRTLVLQWFFFFVS